MASLITRLLAAAAAIGAFAVAGTAPASAAAEERRAGQGKLVQVEQFRLGNGLKVVFHVDRSDPVVAVALNAHVGSSREKPGRTGFAHMFEHLLFLESENLGRGGLDKLSARIGGSGANGSTSRDITDYLQTVPSDALEKLIWAEADKLGWFINTVTEPVLAKEKQVVKNERRQGVDNQPYGHLETVLTEALYPAGHPYSWTVIGSMADLDAATLDDVREFYRRWYVPNNVTLVVAGDFDTAQARKWVEKYFGEIPRGEAVTPMTPQPAVLQATKRLYHEDNFAQLPQLTLAWPSIPNYHPDSYALDVLFDLLTDGRKAPMHAVIVDERKLAGEVEAQSDRGKLAGEAYLNVRAFAGVDLDRVQEAIEAGFARFERGGIDPAALARVKTLHEVAAYERIGSVLGKASRIARFDLYAGTPDFADREVENIRAVGADDVLRVYRRYVKGRPLVAASFVPKGKAQLALAGSERARVSEEPIVQGAEAAVDASAAAAYRRTASSFDRRVEPPYGERAQLKLPPIARFSFANGLQALGIEDRELPLALFELSVEGGRLMDRLDKPGAASLLARLMTRGTRRRTPAELEEALKSLGAEISIEARDEHFVLTGRTLARNLAATVDLVEEILFEPRWDPAELELAKAAAASEIQDEKTQPEALAERAFRLATYGDKHIFSRSALGTEKSVAAMSMADLQGFHSANLAPNAATFRLVGAVDEAQLRTALADLGSKWKRREVAAPAYPAAAPPASARLFFYDVPDAKQSVLAFGMAGPARASEDYYPAVVANYILGGGGFASRLTQQLREGKGYTYGIRSGFFGGVRGGTFELTSPVRANVTLEAAELARSIMADYPRTFDAADLEVTKSYLTRSRSRAFESAAAKLAYLAAISDHGLPADYPLREQAIVDRMSVEAVRALAARQIRPEAMTYVIVGDAATQAARLKALGLGEPVMLNEAIGRIDE